MRTIGLIGGMSWESSAVLPLDQRGRQGEAWGHHSAETVMYSVDFAPIKHLQHEDKVEEAATRRRRRSRGAGLTSSCYAPTSCTGWRASSPRP